MDRKTWILVSFLFSILDGRLPRSLIVVVVCHVMPGTHNNVVGPYQYPASYHIVREFLSRTLV